MNLSNEDTILLREYEFKDRRSGIYDALREILQTKETTGEKYIAEQKQMPRYKIYPKTGTGS